jgi:hypothetical protein
MNTETRYTVKYEWCYIICLVFFLSTTFLLAIRIYEVISAVKYLINSLILTIFDACYNL